MIVPLVFLHNKLSEASPPIHSHLDMRIADVKELSRDVEIARDPQEILGKLNRRIWLQRKKPNGLMDKQIELYPIIIGFFCTSHHFHRSTISVMTGLFIGWNRLLLPLCVVCKWYTSSHLRYSVHHTPICGSDDNG